MSKKINRREFLEKTATGASALALSGVVFSPLGAKAKMPNNPFHGFRYNKEWSNWCNRLTIEPKKIFRPTRVDQLQRMVSEAVNIRAIGSSHSISGVAPCLDTLINTNGIKGITFLDEQRSEVTVAAGTKLRKFSNDLADMGYALPSTGDTFYQSLAGLLSTGTHGTGMRWGSCSDEECLVGMDLVLADGSLRTLRADRPKDKEFLAAARVSLGTLGVVTSVTLKVVPIHMLEHRGVKMSINEALDPLHVAENDHYEFAYFPYNNMCYAFKRNITDQPRKRKKKFKRFLDEYIVENHLADFLLNIGSLSPAIIEDIHREFFRMIPERHDINRCDRVMTMPRTVPAYLMEYAIPIENTKAAAEAFRDLTLDLTKRPRGKRFYTNLPAQVRFVRGDRGTLISPGQGRDTCWFGVGSYVFYQNSDIMFQEMEKILIGLGGRPHWGKLFYRNPTRNVPGWEQFVALRDKVDPTGKFSNKFMQRLLAESDHEIIDKNY